MLKDEMDVLRHSQEKVVCGFAICYNLVKCQFNKVSRHELCARPAVNLTSAGSRGTLQLDRRVFQCSFGLGFFSGPERFGAVGFKHSPTLPTFVDFISPPPPLH